MDHDLKKKLDAIPEAELISNGYTRLVLPCNVPLLQTVAPETLVAARWWAGQLRQPPQMDNGDLVPVRLGFDSRIVAIRAAAR